MSTACKTVLCAQLRLDRRLRGPTRLLEHLDPTVVQARPCLVSSRATPTKKPCLHSSDVIRCSESQRKLALGGFPGQCACELHGRIIIMQQSQSLLILGQKRENEAKMMDHAHMRLQRREIRYDEVRSGICTSVRKGVRLDRRVHAHQCPQWYRASCVESECRRARCRVYPTRDASSPVVGTRTRSSKSGQTLGKYTRGRSGGRIT